MEQGAVVSAFSSPPALLQQVPATALSANAEWGGVELLESIADEWRALCPGARGDQPFYRPEWIAAAMRAFEAASRILLLTVREGSRLCAILPLVENHSRVLGIPFTTLRSATNPDHSCRFDVILAAGANAAAVISAIWNCLKRVDGWDSLEFSNVPPEAVLERLLALSARDGYGISQNEFVLSPYIVLDRPGSGDFSQFACSANLKKNLRRRWHRFQEAGTVELRRMERADPEALRQFYSLEASGWKGQAGSAILCDERTKRFYDAVAESADRFGYLSLYFLELSGTVVAANFGLTFAGKYYPLKVAYDEIYSTYGPGHLMKGAVLQDAVRRGLIECDCLGDRAEWKAQWTTETRRHTLCYVFNTNLPARLRRLQISVQCKKRMVVRQVLHPLAVSVRAYLSRRKQLRAASSSTAGERESPAASRRQSK